MTDAPLIFVVDDDNDFLEMETTILGGAGYRVKCFSDPRAAFEAATAPGADCRPSLVVTDLMMKSLDAGFSLAVALKTHPALSAVPVIVVSAVSSQKGFDFRPRTAEDLAAMNADAFFDKPVAPQALLGKVKELLR